MKKVVNDPGHGGSDPGATGNGLREKDFTLPVSLSTDRNLKKDYKVEAVLTRNTDKFLSLTARAEMAKGADLFVSHHADWNASPDPRGFWTWRNTSVLPETPGYQKIVHDEIMAYLKILNVPDRGLREANHVITRLPPCPTVLIEWMFVSNPVDAAILKNPEYVEKMGKYAARGIAKALDLPRKIEDQPAEPETRYRVIVNSEKDYFAARDAKQDLKRAFPTHSPFIVLNEVNGKEWFRVVLREVERIDQARAVVEAVKARGLYAWFVSQWEDLDFDIPEDEVIEYETEDPEPEEVEPESPEEEEPDPDPEVPEEKELPGNLIDLLRQLFKLLKKMFGGDS